MCGVCWIFWVRRIELIRWCGRKEKQAPQKLGGKTFCNDDDEKVRFLARSNNRKEKTYLIQKRNSFSSEVEDNCVLLKLGAYFKLCSDAVNPEVKDAKIWLCSMKYSFKDIIGSILWVINALLASQWCCILHHDIKC